LILPTVSPDELSAWRGDFVAGQSAIDPDTAARLTAWKEQRLPSTFLPLPLRGEWNQELKTRVEKRLRGWFDERRIRPPADLSSAFPSHVVDRLAALRALIVECVSVMTDRELAEVRLPPTAVQKILERRRTGDS